MRILSGIQASGKIHLGNHFGAISRFLTLQEQGEALFFIADLHAINSVRDGQALRDNTLDIALDFLALGLDPDEAILFRQSDISEVTELFWYLSALAPMGLLERAHAYKDKLAAGVAPELGLFSYPVLMAADILAYRADVVPVGKDQAQHLEITRDLAVKFNATYVPGWSAADPEGTKTGKPGILRLPEGLVAAEAAVVPGTDLRKMSKSYGNTIDVFAPDKVVKKQIMGITTDSTPVEAPKDPAATPLHALLALFASADELAEHTRSMREGGKGWGHYKVRLLELFHERLGPARARREELAKDPATVARVLAAGAEKARAIAAPVLRDVRRAVGTGG